MKAGDYVQLRRRFPPFLRRGTRGLIIDVGSHEVVVRLKSSATFVIPKDNLTVIDRGQGGIVWQSTQS